MESHKNFFLSKIYNNVSVQIYIDKISQQAEQIGALKNEIETLKRQVIDLKNLRKSIPSTHSTTNNNAYELPEFTTMLVAEPEVKYSKKNIQKTT